MAGFGRSNTRAGKLNPSKVREIRERYNMGETQRDLGVAFGVSTNQIGRIVRGESWGGFEGVNRGGSWRNEQPTPPIKVEDELPAMSEHKQAEVHKEIQDMIKRREIMAQLQSGGTYARQILSKRDEVSAVAEVNGIPLPPDFVPNESFEEVKAPDADELLNELEKK